jgi:hypothetical protein
MRLPGFRPVRGRVQDHDTPGAPTRRPIPAIELLDDHLCIARGHMPDYRGAIETIGME